MKKLKEIILLGKLNLFAEEEDEVVTILSPVIQEDVKVLCISNIYVGT